MKQIWLVLFVIYSGYAISELLLFGFLQITRQEEVIEPTLRDFAKELAIVILLIGFYGFITSKKIINKVFWQTAFILILVFDAANIISDIAEYGTNIFEAVSEVWWVPLLLLSSLPSYVAVYIYSFKRKGIWI